MAQEFILTNQKTGKSCKLKPRFTWGRNTPFYRITWNTYRKKQQLIGGSGLLLESFKLVCNTLIGNTMNTEIVQHIENDTLYLHIYLV